MESSVSKYGFTVVIFCRASVENLAISRRWCSNLRSHQEMVDGVETVGVETEVRAHREIVVRVRKETDHRETEVHVHRVETEVRAHKVIGLNVHSEIDLHAHREIVVRVRKETDRRETEVHVHRVETEAHAHREIVVRVRKETDRREIVSHVLSRLL